MRVSSGLIRSGAWVATCASLSLATVLVGCSSSPASTAPKDGGAADGTSDGYIAIVVDDSGSPPDVKKAKDSGQPDTSTPVDTGSPANDGPSDAEKHTFPAFSPPVPQVQTFGGEVLAAPIFVPIIFAGDTYASQIPGFMAAIGQSDYWTASMAEYGVGAGRSATPIVLDETMPSVIDDLAIQRWLANKLGTDPRFGALPGTSLFGDAGADATTGEAGSTEAGSADGVAAEAGALGDGGLPEAGEGGLGEGGLTEGGTAIDFNDANAPLNDADSPLARAPLNVVYAMFFPDGTRVTMGGGSSCSSFGGYHNSFTYAPNGSKIVYAIVPRCGSFGALGGFGAVTGPMSHELAEAATDPFVGGNGEGAAYAQVDEAHLFWEILLGGGEVGDMCAQFPTAFYNPSETSMNAYTVQRIWSNKAALAGNDPCVPALPVAQEQDYFSAFPNFIEQTVVYNGESLDVYDIVAKKNKSTPIEIDLFSNAATAGGAEPVDGNWTVQVFDGNYYFTGAAQDLTITPSQQSGTNGDKLTFNVTNLANDGLGSRPILVISTNAQHNIQNWWIGAVSDSTVE